MAAGCIAVSLFGDERLPQQYWARVDINPETGCWNWAGSTYRKGYGQFWLHDHWERAHRLAYETLVAPIPDGLVIDHLCRVTNCVNPMHLEPVTGTENLRRGIQSFRVRTHCLSGLHELNEDNIVDHSDGRKRCRACRLAAARKRYARRRAQQEAA